DGVDIGNVEAIRLVPRTQGKSPEKSHNIELVLKLDKRFQDDILTDSTAVLVTEGLLGNRYVNIQRGFTGVPLKDNQEVAGVGGKKHPPFVGRQQGRDAGSQRAAANHKEKNDGSRKEE